MNQDQLDLAYKLASEGASNAVIFGALNITSGALSALMQTRPHLLFAMINGRKEYIDELTAYIAGWASGEEPLTKLQYSAVCYLLDKADNQNKILTVAHEIILLSGQAAPDTEEKHDPATVTKLLRQK
jgi:hypothetical protein